jgi:hypothetical protein
MGEYHGGCIFHGLDPFLVACGFDCVCWTGLVSIYDVKLQLKASVLSTLPFKTCEFRNFFSLVRWAENLVPSSSHGLACCQSACGIEELGLVKI